MGMNIRVKECNVSTWREFKNIRLESLIYEPDAFSSLLKDTEKYPDSYWIDMVSDINNIVLLAYVDNGCVGIIRAALKDEDVNEETAFIGSFYVNSKYRRKGIGKMLMRDLIDRIKRHSEISYVRLWVSDKQYNAIHFYEDFGFKYVGKEENEKIFEKNIKL